MDQVARLGPRFAITFSVSLRPRAVVPSLPNRKKPHSDYCVRRTFFLVRLIRFPCDGAELFRIDARILLNSRLSAFSATLDFRSPRAMRLTYETSRRSSQATRA